MCKTLMTANLSPRHICYSNGYVPVFYAQLYGTI